MTDQQPEDSGYDSAALDELIDSAMSGILAKLEANFEPDAGLADIHARAAARGHGFEPGNSAEPGTAPRRAGASAQAGASASARLQEVCGHIDMIDAWLAAVIRSAQAAPFGGVAFLEAARPALMQLRLGLVNRTLGKSDAGRFVDEIQRDLGQADRIIRSQHGSTLDEVIVKYAAAPTGSEGALSADTETLQEMIDRLYADADHDPTLVPGR
jgi:hypothetical protein